MGKATAEANTNNEQGSNEIVGGKVQAPSFKVKDLHKKALVTLLHCYHNNRQALTYAELSRNIDIGEKTKSWQCEAWKDLNKGKCIVELSIKKDGKKCYELSENGLAFAMSFASDEDLAEFKAPETNEELHEKIKAKLIKVKKAAKYGPLILDKMSAPDYVPQTRHELAAQFNVLADSHGFFYGLKAMKTLGYVVDCSKEEMAELSHMAELAKANAAPETQLIVDDPGSAVDDAGEEATSDKKRPADDASLDSEGMKPKKKVYKSARKRSGGKPLKLSDTAFVTKPTTSMMVVRPETPPNAASSAAATAVTPDIHS